MIKSYKNRFIGKGYNRIETSLFKRQNSEMKTKYNWMNEVTLS